MKSAALTGAGLPATTAATPSFSSPDPAAQATFKNHKSNTPNNPHERFVQKFSGERSAIGMYLQDQVTKMYAGQTVTVTQEPDFDGRAWAAASEEPVPVRELPHLEHINLTSFRRPLRRRGGPGTAVEQTVSGGWKVTWRDAEFDVIMASWVEGHASMTQWHIIAKNKEDADKLIQQVMEHATSRDVIWVFDMGNWQPDRELWQSVQKASWDDVVLDTGLKKSIQNDYRMFFKSEETYTRLNVPWKRGIIFLGPPGNGKAISLKAIMHEVKIPILYVKTFAGMMSDEFSIGRIFHRAREEAPCIVVLEDLDNLITDSDRSFFLNEVDGINDNDGILMIGTTNHFDRLDPGISNRPSRFDRKYTFPNPSKEQRQDYVRYWRNKLKDNEDVEFPDSLIDEFADETDGFSFAYLKEAFGEPDDFRTALMKQVEHLRKELEGNPDAMNMCGRGLARSGPGMRGRGFAGFRSRH